MRVESSLLGPRLLSEIDRNRQRGGRKAGEKERVAMAD